MCIHSLIGTCKLTYDKITIYNDYVSVNLFR